MTASGSTWTARRCSGLPAMTTTHGSITAIRFLPDSTSSSGNTIKYTYLGEERVAYIFTDSNQHDGSKDYIYCNEYEGNTDPNKRIYKYGVGDLGTSKDFSYIKNFVVNKNSDGTLKIDFDVDSTNIDTEFDFSPWLCLNFGLPCVESNIKFN